jgi:GNAT superfamily N-acetyltransferase
MNLVTVPPYRRRGIARRVMRAMLQWLMDHGIQVIALHASEGGRPLYQELGFAPSNEMRLKIKKGSGTSGGYLPPRTQRAQR